MNEEGERKKRMVANGSAAVTSGDGGEAEGKRKSRGKGRGKEEELEAVDGK